MTIDKQGITLIHRLYFSIHQDIELALEEVESLESIISKVDARQFSSALRHGKSGKQYAQLDKKFKKSIRTIKELALTMQGKSLPVLKSLILKENLLHQQEHYTASNELTNTGHLVNLRLPELENADEETKEKYRFILHVQRVLLSILTDIEMLCDIALSFNFTLLYFSNQYTNIWKITEVFKDELSQLYQFSIQRLSVENSSLHDSGFSV